MRRLAVAVVASIALVIGLVSAWRRNPRLGSARMNRLVNPVLLRRGFAGGGRSELGIIEHVGRHTGIRRLTPIRAVPSEDGFRIMVPLGLRSHWAQNVLAAGHCRMQFREAVYELDEPQLLAPTAMQELPMLGRLLTGGLGFLYLRLHTFAQHPGKLEPESEGSQPVEARMVATAPAAEATPTAASPELVTAAAG